MYTNLHALPTISITLSLFASVASQSAQAQTTDPIATAQPTLVGRLKLVRLPEATRRQSDSASSRNQLYVHAFRSPSTGVEFRTGNIGFHTGLYTTILNDEGDSTEFIKAGITGYFGGRRNSRLEGFFSVGYLRGINGDYKDRNGLFLEPGVRFGLGRQLELRVGVGLLLADGRPTHINPTIGLSWAIPLK